MSAKIEQYGDMLARLFPTDKGKVAASARTVTFQVTDDCNLKCTYCYQINKSKHKMPFDVAKRFVDMILNGNKLVGSDISDAIIIEFIGGEPLLEIDLIDQITDYFILKMIELRHPWATRYRISICSNGVLYMDPRVQRYIKKHRDTLSFSISIDGDKKLHDSCRVFPDGSGSYDIAIAGVKHYTEQLGYKMGSKMTIAPENVGFVFEAVKSLIQNGYTDINLNCVYEEGWTITHAKELYKQLSALGDYLIENNLLETHDLSIFNEDTFFRPKLEGDDQNWCGGTGQMLAVDYKGDIYPCIRYMESSLGCSREPIIIGNVYDGVLQTEKEKTWNGCLQCITRRTQCTDWCYYCPIASGCSWCSAYNYQVYGTPNKKACYICVMHIARALANVRLWNRYYLQAGINKTFTNYVPESWAEQILDEDEIAYLNYLEFGLSNKNEESRVSNCDTAC